MARLLRVWIGVILGGLPMFVRTARAGRPRVARNCLLIAAGLGLPGLASNLVG